VVEPKTRRYVAECFWPDVTPGDLRALDKRVSACARELARSGEAVRYLGSILIRADEVVLCRFEGDPQAVRRTADLAAIPFERILETAQPPWPCDTSEGENN
jgi:hypothetical protein